MTDDELKYTKEEYELAWSRGAGWRYDHSSESEREVGIFVNGMKAERTRLLKDLRAMWEEADKFAMMFAKENKLQDKDEGYIYADMKLQYFERKLREMEGKI